MLFDEWNNSQRSNVTSGSTGLQSGLRSHGHQGYDHQGYDSDEDMNQPTATAGLHRYQGINQTHTQIGGGAMMTSAIVSSPNDPSLQSMDQINGGPSLDDEKMFQLERLDWRPSKEQGAVVGLAVGSGLLFIATQNCNIIRWNVETDEFEEIVLSKRADDRIHKVFLDPTGNHGIISMENGQVYYMHTKWSKAHLLSKVKNVIIESIAWNTAFGTETSTKKILIGTNRGHIYETCIEEKDKYFKKVHDLIFDDLSVPSSTSSSSSSSTPSNDLTTTTPVSGLYMELFPSSADAGEAGQKWFVMAATPNRQFQFIGGPTFEALFAKYTGNIPNSFRDFPGDLSYSELRTFSKYQGRSKASVADSVAWMNGVGIFYGNLVFGSQDKGQDVLQDGKLLAYPNIIDPATGRPTPPVSLTLTEFHFILVMKNRLLAINQLSEEIVYEEVFNTSTFGEMRGLAMDARKDTVWLYSDKCVFAVDIIKEDRDVWKLYLQQGQYELALEYCDSDAQAERVNNAKADALFEQGLFEQAAKIYADTGRSFEEVALKFVHISAGLPVPIPTTLTGQTISPISTRITPVLQAEARTALKTYLLTKLDHHIEPTELTQQVMICTWLTEIFLDNINRLQEGTYESATSLLRKRLTTSKGFVPTTSPFPDMSPSSDDVGSNTFDPSESETEDLALLAEERAQARENEVREFRAFLKEYLDCLNAQTTFELISSHGRIHELLYFAETIGDFEWVLTYHLQQGNYFQALDILANHPNPTNIAEKFYKFCPTLMHYLPKQTVDMLCQLGKQLDPSKLIPALMRYGDARSNRDAGAGASRSQRRHRRRPITSDHKRSESDLDADDIESDEDDHSSADDADYDNENGEDGPNHAIRYLEHMIIKLRNRDPILHNYLISLYATQKDERPLEAFVESQRGKIIFDYKYALRICHENGKYRSCVSIYESMKLYEEAVRMALEIDLERAKSVVAHAQDEGLLDPTLSLGDHQQKRLWILIAKHVIAHEQDISKAMSILKECDVRLEEILPFFPDFVRIGDFKEEICKSLDQYNAKIEHLKSEMEEYTDSANLIRADITALRSRFGVVTANQKCDLCSQQVLTSQFLLFPCTHAFHMSCCIAEATKYLQAHPHRKAQVLADEEYKDANSSLSGSSTSSSSNPSSRGPLQPLIDQSAKDTRDQRSIENFAASECCLCGEMMIASVSTPFITLPEEDQEAKAWEI